MNKMKTAIAATAVSGAAALAIWVGSGQVVAGPTVEVYKSPTCGCCKDWVSHMRENGFEVKVHNMQDVTPFKQKMGVPRQLSSCHTATVDGYLVEGHVPATDVRRMLSERPAIKGISAPGMPVGSPGMEMGDRKDPYSVVTFDDRGEMTIYSRH